MFPELFLLGEMGPAHLSIPSADPGRARALEPARGSCPEPELPLAKF